MTILINRIGLLVILSLPYSCYNNNGILTTNSTSIDTTSRPNNSDISDLSDLQEEISYGNPDTSLCIFLYKHIMQPKFESQKEEFIRLDLEYNKIIELFNSIYHNREDYNIKFKMIKYNRIQFLRYIRSIVLETYRQYNGVSGLEFDFLVERKDSLVKPVLLDLLANKKAPIDEKNYAKSVLKNF